jgi:hypothetical protein
MFLAKISGILGDMFRFMYGRVCCRLCIGKRPTKKPMNQTNGDYLNDPNKINDVNNNSNKLDVKNTNETLNNNTKHNQMDNNGKFGQTRQSGNLTEQENEGLKRRQITNHNSNDIDSKNINNNGNFDPNNPNNLNNNPNNANVIDDYDEMNDLPDDDDKITVPLTVTMLIITGYILIGAVVFNQFEKWTIVEGAYFCFITLSTIGFGKLYLNNLKL